MPSIEELEQRVLRLETPFEEVIKEKLAYISQRLDQLYDLYTKLYEKTEKDKTGLLEKMSKDKRDLVYWMVGLVLGFSTLTITAIWAILSFALE